MPHHTMMSSKWHFCARCGKKVALADMKWQGGILLGPECIDTGDFPLIGERDTFRTKLEAQYGDSQELQPDKILTEGSHVTDEDVAFQP